MRFSGTRWIATQAHMFDDTPAAFPHISNLGFPLSQFRCFGLFCPKPIELGNSLSGCLHVVRHMSGIFWRHWKQFIFLYEDVQVHLSNCLLSVMLLLEVLLHPRYLKLDKIFRC